MTASTSNRVCEYLGWANAPWSFKEHVVGFAKNIQEVKRVVESLGLGTSAMANIKNEMTDLNFKEKQIAFLYLPVGGSQQYYMCEPSVNETYLFVKVIDVSAPEGGDFATMGARVLIITAPKEVRDLQVVYEKLDFEVQPELKSLQHVPSLETEKLWLETYQVAREGYDDERIRLQNWFKKLNETEQSKALQLVEEQRRLAEYENAKWKAYMAIADRLLVRNFDQELKNDRIRNTIVDIWYSVKQYFTG